jgi:DNA-binding MarR family transcriptional regulator
MPDTEFMTREGGAAAEPSVNLDELSSSVDFVLRRARLAVHQDLLASMAAEDIRPAQYAVLVVLGANPGLRQNQVCAALEIRTTNFVTLFDGLESRRLAERRPIAGDRRARGLFLTDAGALTLARLKVLQAQHEARFAARLGAEGKQQLVSLLQRLTDPAFD